ncbi:SMI1/KNR4 family protein [Streptomyces fildesensis]|uniref:SMI1/KNR4 family protein n=1 Tax=Streptomyces fildesensis TaxID=375757 RepID=A0ABW8CJI9_9ACTN
MAAPVGGGDSVDWGTIRADYGWQFPNDYKEFVAVYGMGSIGDSLFISTPPFSEYPYASHLLSETPYPPPGGLLCWGTNEGGDDFLWRCADADPEQWTIVIRTRDQTLHEYDMGIGEFLLNVISGNLVIPLTASLEIDPPVFETWREEDLRMKEEGELEGF